jgi:threonine dehydratase
MAAARVRVPAVVIMPTTAPHTKAAASQAYGAEVIRHGSSFREAQQLALQLAQERRLTLIPGFNDSDVIAGQGTVALEIMEDLPHFDAILVPVGGGGLIAGIAVAVRTKLPDAKIIGVQSELAPAVAQSLVAGTPVSVRPGPTIADGIAVERPGDLPFAIIKEAVDEVVTVGEEDLARAIRLLAQRTKLVAEAAGAAPLAAALAGAVHLEGRTVVFVLSGGNIDLERLSVILGAGAGSESASEATS